MNPKQKHSVPGGINAADVIYFCYSGDLFGTAILTRPQQGCREDNNSNTTRRSRNAITVSSSQRSGSSSDGGERDSKRKVQDKLLCAEDSAVGTLQKHCQSILPAPTSTSLLLQLLHRRHLGLC